MARFVTHEVTNQVPALADYNAWAGDRILRATVSREGAAWVGEQAQALGAQVGSATLQHHAHQANRYVPELRTHDRFGQRIDVVDYHPAYHALMQAAFCAGLHSLAWTAKQAGGFVARAALNYLWNQNEQGTSCPVTMTFAAVHVLRTEAALAQQWEPKIVATAYDPRPLPLAQKSAVTVGMAMTEKQGGSDLRAITTRARAIAGGQFALTGHKWFCSAPMSDGFLTLARTEAGPTCFLVPRSLPDGSRNTFLVQRLKDKCGNRSNASGEIEYDDTLGWRVGADGRGIATIIEMAHLTRFDIVVANAGQMRGLLNQALHHCAHRTAFGHRLHEHALMQNVLADLALEAEAAMLCALRLARAFDRQRDDAHEAGIARLMTPLAKYWTCKRLPAVAVEAMECLGGAGYVEEAPLARLYREAPLNGIWEGSGNVICLDVLRTMQKEPAALKAVLDEIDQAARTDARLGAHHRITRATLDDSATAEVRARVIVERLALELSAALMIAFAPAPQASAYVAARIEGEGGYQFGTLPAGTPFGAIVQRAQLEVSP